MPPLWKLAGRNYNFVRIAGLSGAAAVILGALGSHSLQDKTEARTIFETANRFHFFHSLAILGLPLTKRPLLVCFPIYIALILVLIFIFLCRLVSFWSPAQHYLVAHFTIGHLLGKSVLHVLPLLVAHVLFSPGCHCCFELCIKFYIGISWYSYAQDRNKTFNLIWS